MKADNPLFQQVARIGQAIGSAPRLALLDMLRQGPRTVEALAQEVGLSFANTSQHLQILSRAGLVQSRRHGNRVIYRLASERVGELWSSVRDVAARHVAEVNGLADEYLGDRAGLEHVTADDLADRLASGEVVLLDVRPESEFRAGHIAGARSAPLPSLDTLVPDLSRRREIVAYCRGHYCVYADDAVRLLRAHGLKARRLDVGFPEWRRAGLPVETPT